MRARLVFRPSVLTSWGTWRDLEGDFDLDTGVLWVEVVSKPGGIIKGRRGIHVATRTEIEPLAEPDMKPQGKKAA